MGSESFSHYTGDFRSNDYDRVTRVDYADSSNIQSAYSGLTETDTNQNHNSVAKTRNRLGQILSYRDEAWNYSAYVYDGFGDLLSATDPLGNNVTFTYDVRGHKTGSNLVVTNTPV